MLQEEKEKAANEKSEFEKEVEFLRNSQKKTLERIATTERECEHLKQEVQRLYECNKEQQEIEIINGEQFDDLIAKKDAELEELKKELEKEKKTFEVVESNALEEMNGLQENLSSLEKNITAVHEKESDVKAICKQQQSEELEKELEKEKKTFKVVENNSLEEMNGLQEIVSFLENDITAVHEKKNCVKVICKQQQCDLETMRVQLEAKYKDQEITWTDILKKSKEKIEKLHLKSMQLVENNKIILEKDPEMKIFLLEKDKATNENSEFQKEIEFLRNSQKNTLDKVATTVKECEKVKQAVQRLYECNKEKQEMEIIKREQFDDLLAKKDAELEELKKEMEEERITFKDEERNTMEEVNKLRKEEVKKSLEEGIEKKRREYDVLKNQMRKCCERSKKLQARNREYEERIRQLEEYEVTSKEMFERCKEQFLTTKEAEINCLLLEKERERKEFENAQKFALLEMSELQKDLLNAQGKISEMEDTHANKINILEVAQNTAKEHIGQNDAECKGFEREVQGLSRQNKKLKTSEQRCEESMEKETEIENILINQQKRNTRSQDKIVGLESILEETNTTDEENNAREILSYQIRKLDKRNKEYRNAPLGSLFSAIEVATKERISKNTKIDKKNDDVIEILERKVETLENASGSFIKEIQKMKDGKSLNDDQSEGKVKQYTQHEAYQLNGSGQEESISTEKLLIVSILSIMF